MRKFILALALSLLGGIGALAQTTTVSGSVFDTSGQAWNNGTFTFATRALGQAPVTGNITSNGTYSASIPHTAATGAVGDAWVVSVCPQAAVSSGCSISPIVINGATQTLNITPAAISINVGVIPGPTSVAAYNDAEIVGGWLGFSYYNASLGTLRTCVAFASGSCTSWTSSGGSLSLPPGTQTPTQAPVIINVPVQAPGVIQSITSTGSGPYTWTMTCDRVNCGLVGTPAMNFGMSLPAGCADATANITLSGTNVITIPGQPTSCTATSGPYPNQLGQVGNAILLQNQAAIGTNYYTQLQQSADGHTWIKVFNAGALATQLSMQSGGTSSFGSNTKGVALWMSPDSIVCMGAFAQLENNCIGNGGVGFNQNGQLGAYGGLSAAGQSFYVFTASGNTTGNLTNTSFYTAPASGLGGNTMYHLRGVLTETSTVASATAFVTVTWTPRVGSAQTMSTCSVAATNWNCLGTTGVATAMAAIGNSVPFDIAFELGNSQTVSISVTTTNSPVYDYFYQLSVDKN